MFSKAVFSKGKNCRISKKAYIGFEEHGGEIVCGDNVVIRPGVVLRTCTGVIKIGNSVAIGFNSIIHALGGVTIGDNTLLSPTVQIYAQNHGIKRDGLIAHHKQTSFGVVVGKDCWIGAGTIITDNVTIGNGVVIGAGSVVTSGTKINDYEIWGGNPAVKIGERK